MAKSHRITRRSGKIDLMQSADRPYQARRLAGVDQALGGGGARRPAELLGQLRDRLDQLAANHPSAVTEGNEPSASEPPPETSEQLQIAENPELGDPPDEPEEVEAPSGSDEPLQQEGSAVERVGGVPGIGVSGNVVGLPSPHGRLGKGEPYRPWFASDEPGDPWFVD